MIHEQLTPAIPAKAKHDPEVTVSFIESGQMVNRSVNLASKADRSNLNRLMIWAAHNGVELRIRPVHS